jgi:hypothetical protein
VVALLLLEDVPGRIFVAAVSYCLPAFTAVFMRKKPLTTFAGALGSLYPPMSLVYSFPRYVSLWFGLHIYLILSC